MPPQTKHRSTLQTPSTRVAPLQHHPCTRPFHNHSMHNRRDASTFYIQSDPFPTRKTKHTPISHYLVSLHLRAVVTRRPSQVTATLETLHLSKPCVERSTVPLLRLSRAPLRNELLHQSLFSNKTGTPLKPEDAVCPQQNYTFFLGGSHEPGTPPTHRDALEAGTTIRTEPSISQAMIGTAHQTNPNGPAAIPHVDPERPQTSSLLQSTNKTLHRTLRATESHLPVSWHPGPCAAYPSRLRDLHGPVRPSKMPFSNTEKAFGARKSEPTHCRPSVSGVVPGPRDVWRSITAGPSARCAFCQSYVDLFLM
ncbi:hypothetical protein BDZ85DRAFT_54771 [Elsinoe ampelina]|uniref:Uncharacterized protein n=1 Tax=Elsinoe ampelina TaxID=302913 RepID=A0A6A6GN80_9PEZI|nr:hypothetical protein BDZ85DRAFT_54771 [Elsinoe ampelina]